MFSLRKQTKHVHLPGALKLLHMAVPCSFIMGAVSMVSRPLHTKCDTNKEHENTEYLHSCFRIKPKHTRYDVISTCCSYGGKRTDNVFLCTSTVKLSGLILEKRKEHVCQKGLVAGTHQLGCHYANSRDHSD